MWFSVANNIVHASTQLDAPPALQPFKVDVDCECKGNHYVIIRAVDDTVNSSLGECDLDVDFGSESSSSSGSRESGLQPVMQAPMRCDSTANAQKFNLANHLRVVLLLKLFLLCALLYFACNQLISSNWISKLRQ